jgi:hypothetical protein
LGFLDLDSVLIAGLVSVLDSVFDEELSLDEEAAVSDLGLSASAAFL